MASSKVKEKGRRLVFCSFFGDSSSNHYGKLHSDSVSRMIIWWAESEGW